MILRKIFPFVLALLLFTSCNESLFDTSTPEKFVESMGMAYLAPDSINPAPYFFDEEYGAAILRFDKAGKVGRKEFDKFRNTIASKFPEHIETNEEGKLEVIPNSDKGFDVVTFTFSATSIGGQMRGRKPSDYEFISATELDEDQVSQTTLKIEGNEMTLPIKKTKKGYRMVLGEEQLENTLKSVNMLENLTEVFVSANQKLDNNEITKDNFGEKIEVILTLYLQAIANFK